MAQRSIQGSIELAEKMKRRRIELGLTIEEAALRAGVGTKTWCRYEAGESIRQDKCKGIGKALGWHGFPDGERDVKKKSLVEEYQNHEAWSQFLVDNFGMMAAMAFAAGSDILLDHIEEDLEELSTMPIRSHLGQLPVSWIRDCLPEQFLMNYDYNFMYRLKCTLQNMRSRAKQSVSMTAHSVLEELIIYLCNEEAQPIIEISVGTDNLIDKVNFDTFDNWVFDLFDDMDIITFLYSDQYLSEEHPYHFNHWGNWQFFMD